jgi:hypothetical protein
VVFIFIAKMSPPSIGFSQSILFCSVRLRPACPPSPHHPESKS